MKAIKIRKATLHNLKNISLDIPLNKLVAVAGPSGCGKSTLIYDILYKDIKKPKTYALSQKVALPNNSKLSLGQYNRNQLNKILRKLEKGDLLILDEPCAGLTSNESKDILSLLKKLVLEGISVIVIEHSREVIEGSDYIIELGPQSGKYGGEIMFQGSKDKFQKSKTLTSQWLSKRTKNHKRNLKKSGITIRGINSNHFKNYTLNFPLYSLTCINGQTATGKTTLIDYAYRSLFKGKNAWQIRKGIDSSNVRGKQNVRRSYLVDQNPIGNHPTSRVSSYLNICPTLRNLYAELSNGLKPSDFVVTRDIIENKKPFPKKVLKVRYKGVNYADLQNLTVDEAIETFSDFPLILRKLSFLQEVGLGYLTLGQPSKSLSGGEAQRIRLAKVLTKKLGDRCVYILDTPSKGLHISDFNTLLKIFRRIIGKNNTILIADNKIEIINGSDHTISL